jgi:tRNA-splicing ligase RtcB
MSADFKKVSDTAWEIPSSYKEGMLVPARIYATRKLLDGMDRGVIEQVTNVACLPGIVKRAYAMADAHWGYGFPIGGVAAFDLETGVISPGGIGFDINCGMRLIRTNLSFSEVNPKIKELVDLMFRLVPAGVGVKGFLRVSDSQFDEIMKYGVKWCAENDLAWEDDPSHVEEGGFIKGADPSKVSRQARSRGIEQLGTLGSGNHYLEIQVVDPGRFYDPNLAKHFGIVKDDQVMVMVHCGSRGFGHQIGSDYLRIFDGAMKRYNLTVRDRELACAPFSSKEGKDYEHGFHKPPGHSAEGKGGVLQGLPPGCGIYGYASCLRRLPQRSQGREALLRWIEQRSPGSQERSYQKFWARTSRHPSPL